MFVTRIILKIRGILRWWWKYLWVKSVFQRNEIIVRVCIQLFISRENWPDSTKLREDNRKNTFYWASSWPDLVALERQECRHITHSGLRAWSSFPRRLRHGEQIHDAHTRVGLPQTESIACALSCSSRALPAARIFVPCSCQGWYCAEQFRQRQTVVQPSLL